MACVDASLDEHNNTRFNIFVLFEENSSCRTTPKVAQREKGSSAARSCPIHISTDFFWIIGPWWMACYIMIPLCFSRRISWNTILLPVTPIKRCSVVQKGLGFVNIYIWTRAAIELPCAHDCTLEKRVPKKLVRPFLTWPAISHMMAADRERGKNNVLLDNNSRTSRTKREHSHMTIREPVHHMITIWYHVWKLATSQVGKRPTSSPSTTTITRAP